MEGEIKVTVTVRGLKNPGTAVNAVVNMIKRSLFLVDGEPGRFGAEIESTAPGRAERLVLEDGEWRRERDSNSRGLPQLAFRASAIDR